MGSALAAFTEDHPRPWTTAEWLALGELPAWPRLELIDGSLHLSPHATLDHQRVCTRLARLLGEAIGLHAARPGEHTLEVFTPANVVLDGTSAVIPDVVVCRGGLTGLAARAEDVLLVCEVESPSTRRIDRMVKAEAYAQAGISHYWRVELGTAGPIVCRYVLSRARAAYELAGTTGPGQTFTAALPGAARVDFDPADLAR